MLLQEWFNVRGVYFKDYFDQPSRAQIGTMVAILEVGAFCTDLDFKTDDSFVTRCGSNRRYNRPTQDHLVWSIDICCRWVTTNMCMEHGYHDNWAYHIWRWSGTIIVMLDLTRLIVGQSYQFINPRYHPLIIGESWHV